MASIGWLHLTDLHFGLPGQRWLWPTVKEQFYQDLERLHAKSGPWDLVLFTGDLTQRGTKEEFDRLTEALDNLWDHVARLGSKPALITVPGNHDLQRPKLAPTVRALRTWNDHADLREEFWGSGDNEYRAVVSDAFAAYEAFVKDHPLPTDFVARGGMLPGDRSISLERDGLKLALVGLNSAFLQLEGGDYKGKLDLDVRQLHGVCGDDPPEWIRQHHATLFLTHHPAAWLHSRALAGFKAEIAPPGRFLAHLFGHMHEGSTTSLAVAGTSPQRAVQGPSLFGLETWGDGPEQRIHGYMAGRISLAGTQGVFKLWPRELRKNRAGAWQMTPDGSFDLREEAAVEEFTSRKTTALPSASPPTVTTLMGDDPPDTTRSAGGTVSLQEVDVASKDTVPPTIAAILARLRSPLSSAPQSPTPADVLVRFERALIKSDPGVAASVEVDAGDVRLDGSCEVRRFAFNDDNKTWRLRITWGLVDDPETWQSIPVLDTNQATQERAVALLPNLLSALELERINRHSQDENRRQYLDRLMRLVDRSSSETTPARKDPSDPQASLPDVDASNHDVVEAVLPSRAYGLVMNGGGVKGVAFVGALRELQERVEIHFDKFGGTSAGAIGASILAMGYDVDVLERALLDQPFSSFLDRDWQPAWDREPWEEPASPVAVGWTTKAAVWVVGVLREPFRILGLVVPFLRGALYSSAPVGRFVQYLGQWRPYDSGPLKGQRRQIRDQHIKMALRDLPSTPMIVASSTGAQTRHVFKEDEDVEFAVRSSMAIPGFFEGQRVGRDIYYDGGMVANFAFKEFAGRDKSIRTIGMYLFNGTDPQRSGDEALNLLSLLGQVFRIYQGQDEVAVVQEHKDQIIRIDTSPIHTIDFDLTDADKQLLVLSGRLAVVRFLLEEEHGLPVKPERVPTSKELALLVDQWQKLKEQAEQRLKWPHRFRLWKVYGFALAVIAVFLGGFAFSVIELKEYWDNRTIIDGDLNLGEVVDRMYGPMLNADRQEAIRDIDHHVMLHSQAQLPITGDVDSTRRGEISRHQTLFYQGPEGLLKLQCYSALRGALRVRAAAAADSSDREIRIDTRVFGRAPNGVYRESLRVGYRSGQVYPVDGFDQVCVISLYPGAQMFLVKHGSEPVVVEVDDLAGSVRDLSVAFGGSVVDLTFDQIYNFRPTSRGLAFHEIDTSAHVENEAKESWNSVFRGVVESCLAKGEWQFLRNYWSRMREDTSPLRVVHLTNVPGDLLILARGRNLSDGGMP